MHGLAVRQNAAYIPPYDQSQDNGESQLAYLSYFVVDSPAQIFGMLQDMEGGDGDTQYFVKRMYTQIHFTNCTLFPHYFEAMWVRARTDVTDNVLTWMEDDAIAPTLPYMSMTSSLTFQQKFKILKKKRYLLKPNTPLKLTIKSIHAGSNRPITRDNNVGTITPYIPHKKGNTILIVKAYGVPQIFQRQTDAVPSDATVLSSISIRGVRHDYLSYTTMDEDTGSSGQISNLPGTVITDNIAFNPTLYNAARQNTPTGSVFYVTPNVVQTLSG